MTDKKRIYALGFFDGVHMGHQALLKQCRNLAGQLNCQTAAITFDAHPKSLFSKNFPTLITTCHDRQQLLRRYGIEHIHCFPVSKEVMSTSWEAFLLHLVENGAVGFVCGDDFHFGYRGEGNAAKLQEFCSARQLPCIIVPEQTLNGQRISSTLIRSLIEAGDLEAATAFLGHAHLLSGTVVPGQQLGRKLGVPTANLLIPHGIVTPKLGVYACRAIVDGKWYAAVANVGTRPTVDGIGITVEPWILDFSGDLYGRELCLEFHQFLRPETKFDNLAALTRQIHRDAALTRLYFEKK